MCEMRSTLGSSSSEANCGCSAERKELGANHRTDGCPLQHSTEECTSSADARADQMRFVVKRIDPDEYREGGRHVHRPTHRQ